MGAAGDGDSERERRGERKFVNFAITAVLAFNRRGFVVRRGSNGGGGGLGLLRGGGRGKGGRSGGV